MPLETSRASKNVRFWRFVCQTKECHLTRPTSQGLDCDVTCRHKQWTWVQSVPILASSIIDDSDPVIMLPCIYLNVVQVCLPCLCLGERGWGVDTSQFMNILERKALLHSLPHRIRSRRQQKLRLPVALSRHTVPFVWHRYGFQAVLCLLGSWKLF